MSPFGPRSSILAGLLCVAGAADGSAAPPVDFVRDVRPIFDRHCAKCHGETKQKSGLRLDAKEAAFRGGEAEGPAIVPGKSKESPLVARVSSNDPDLVMPPSGAKLSPEEIATLVRWIDDGAAWPAGVDRVRLDDRRDHWSFRPPTVAPGTHSIDAFVDRRLAENGLHRSPPADPAAWLRRVALDLTGLPPTPEELEAFARRSPPDFAAEVDRLLASPRYGERWAQHWLDVVRYADTHGFEVNTERPHAWHYRDWVVRAFNADVPYDRFVREQIVGDALGADAATGFLVTASVLLPGQIGADDESKRLARQDALDEIVGNIGLTFLGLSVGCARCHDHKFDPIASSEYYSLQAFVAGVEYGERELDVPEARAEAERAAVRLAQVERTLAGFAPLAGAGAERPPVHASLNVDCFAPVRTKRVRFTVRATNGIDPCLDELEVFDTDGANVAAAAGGAKATASGSVAAADRHDLKFVHDGRYGNTRSWLADNKQPHWVEIELVREATIDHVMWSRDREGRFTDRLATDYAIEVVDADGTRRTVADSGDLAPFDPQAKTGMPFGRVAPDAPEAARVRDLLAERRNLAAQVSAARDAQRIFAGTFRSPDRIRVLFRGDPEQPRQEVAPAVPTVLGALRLPQDVPEQDRRRALADWIASPQNPLTARVMANRIWQGHFGTGLVETPSDFGRNGARPSHPELLDWLAVEFVRQGWSIKALHRLIVLSETYRQSSRHDPEAAAQDADARLLWRFPPRRLEAECIRDAMLATSGLLDVRMYGRGFDLFDKRGGLVGFKPVETFSGDGLRRMIWAHKVRRERDAVFGAFDCPDAGQSAARRRESTTAIQALNLFNSRFTLQVADAFAARVRREAGDEPAAQVARAYRLAFGRAPDSDESRDAEQVVRVHGAPVLCRALLNANEFLVVP